AVPLTRAVVAAPFALDLHAQRVVVADGADVQIARHEDVVVARAEYGETAPEHRAELKAYGEILRPGQCVISGHARKAEVADAPQGVDSRDPMIRVAIEQLDARVRPEAVVRDEHRDFAGALVVAGDRRAEQAQTSGRSDTDDAADVEVV